MSILSTRGAGTGGLGLAMEGPSEAKMSCTDNKDGSCSVEYVPYEPGTYNLNITYGGQPITGAEPLLFRDSSSLSVSFSLTHLLVASFVISSFTKSTNLLSGSSIPSIAPFQSLTHDGLFTQVVHSLCRSATRWTVQR